MTIPYTFATQTGPIPLSELDSNFDYFARAITTDSSGNVGINDSSPEAKLSIVQPSHNTRAIELPQYGGANDENYTSIVGKYGVGNEYCQSAVRFGIQSAGIGSGFLAFATGTNSTTERARIDVSGNLLIGTTSSSFTSRQEVVQTGTLPVASFYKNNSNTGSAINVWHGGATGSATATQISFLNAGSSVVGSITSTTTTTAYVTSSDYRLKENIQPMQNALDVVAQLNPVTYNWKENGSEGQGFIAHELQAIVPDCVTGEKDAIDEDGKPVYQGIDTSFLVATLTKAIQELSEQVKSLQEEVATLKAS